MKKGLFAVIVCFTFNAHAGLLLEPYIGYNFTALERGSDGSAATGPMIGGRVGMTILSTIFVAFDYSTGTLDWEPEGAIPNELDGTLTRMGVTAGADIPLAPLRAWIGFYKSEFKPSGGGIDMELKDGEGMKLGLGLTFLPIVDINLEYFNAKYDDYKVNGVTIDQEAKDKGLMLSLSAPFDL